MNKNFITLVKKYFLGNEEIAKYKKEISEHNAHTLYGLSTIGLIISFALLFLSLPFIGVLKLTNAFILLALFFGVAVILSKKVFCKYTTVSVALFYIILVGILSIAIYMGTYAGKDTTATTFVVLLLILSLFIIDRPWRPILINTIIVGIFFIFDISFKSRTDIVMLDMVYSIVVLVINALFVIFSFKRSIERFENRRSVEILAADREYMINSLPVGVAVYEVHGQKVEQTYTNEQFYRLFEDDPESRKNRTTGDFLNSIHPHDQAKLKRTMQRVIVDGEDYISEICRSMKGDGTYLWVRFSSSVAKREGDYLLIYSTYESVEEEIKSKLATQAKTEFLSRMSHDIRTPMNAIIGLTNLAKQENDKEVIYKYLENIEHTSDFLLGLINDILDLNKIESGQFELQPQPYEYEEFVKEVDTVIGPLMRKKNIQFTFDREEDMPCILVDKLRFNQIFFNLLSNASKFTKEGGCVEFIVRKVPEEDGFLGLLITVRDNGIGMSEEFQKNLFAPFVQESNEINDAGTGTGLGLPIVKRLLDAMGASIQVKSELGKGTEYKLKFRVQVVSPPVKTRRGEVAEHSLAGVKILLVEDNDMNILVAQKLLEHHGCQVFVAKNGAEAVKKFADAEAGFYDAILMDVRMPVMDGIEATKKIRNLGRLDSKTVPIIAMTADAFTEEKKRTLDAGMNEHLSKPIEPQKLFGALAELIVQ